MIHPWQIALITLYAFIQPNETRSFNIGMSMPILAGWFTGLLLGNPQTGLVLGGTLQLMTLGVNTYGGTSIPNTTVGAIVGTALSLNSTPELALGIAIPVALLMIQLDILARYANIFFLHRADHFIDERNYDKAAFQNLLGMIAPGLSRAVPGLLRPLLWAKLCRSGDGLDSTMVYDRLAGGRRRHSSRRHLHLVKLPADTL